MKIYRNIFKSTDSLIRNNQLPTYSLYTFKRHGYFVIHDTYAEPLREAYCRCFQRDGGVGGISS
jgi:hypothetical protein